MLTTAVFVKDVSNCLNQQSRKTHEEKTIEVKLLYTKRRNFT